MRLLKKYPNRRLYDTEASRYVTLADVGELVRQGEDIRIVDSESDEDITRSILLQIILEKESAGEPLLTADVLSDLIRFYGNTVPDFFSRYLKDSLSMFASQQQELQKQIGSNPLDVFANLAQTNLEIWNQVQSSFLNAAGINAAPPPDSKKKTG